MATMILQEKQLFKFELNIEKTSGRGPRQGARMACDKGDQIKIAEDFMDIASDEEALEQEAMESENPSWYIPKRKTNHRPRENKSKIISEQNAKKVGEGKKKGKPNKGKTQKEMNRNK